MTLTVNDSFRNFVENELLQGLGIDAGGFWRDLEGLPTGHEIRLHYLSGKIEVELLLPLSMAAETGPDNGLRGLLQQAAADLPWFGGVRVLYE